jgi:hypothetical protein
MVALTRSLTPRDMLGNVADPVTGRRSLRELSGWSLSDGRQVW